MKRKNLILVLILSLTMVLSACAAKDNNGEEKDLVDNKENKPIVSMEDSSKEDEPMKMPPFTLKTIDGEEISSDIFGDYDMTIISLWQST